MSQSIEGIPKNPDKGTLATSIPPVPTGRKPPAPRVSPPLKAEKKKAPTLTPPASATSSQKSTKSPLKPQESKANTQRVELESSSSSDEEPPAKKLSTQKTPSPQKTLSSPPKTTAPPGGRARKASTAHMPPALRKIPETPKPVDAKEDDDEPPVRRCSSYRYAKLEELTDLPLVRDVLAFKLMELQEIQGHKVSKLSDFKEGRVSSVDERLALVQLDLTEPIKIPGNHHFLVSCHTIQLIFSWNRKSHRWSGSCHKDHPRLEQCILP